MKDRYSVVAVVALPAWLELVSNFELHRRKAFWVDEALSYLLDQTELDVMGRELRAPFPCFALVFTDRHVLSLAERLLASVPGAPQAGFILRVLTVYVSEARDGEARTLQLSFAPDALGADLPGLVRHDLPLADGSFVTAAVTAPCRFASATQRLPGPTILSTRGTVSVP
jgi:hypothetical protein